MELTDEIRKEVLKELVEKFEDAISKIRRAREEIVPEMEITVKWLKYELAWYDCPAYKLLNNKFKEENE
jgi:ribosome recycling factor